ncbi:IPT/TIG domain-containing protein, partial [Planctomycetota bacterium]
MKTARITLLPVALLALVLVGCGDEIVTHVTEHVGGPVITAVTPGGGPPAGGTTVTISGTKFQSGATVEFGGTAAASVTFVSDAELTAETPAGTAGTVSVKVTNPDGKSGMLAGAFTYADPPTLDSASPSVIPTAGGATVTLTGTGFEPGASVHLGTELVFPARVSVLSATTITVVTPAHASGAVDVTVTNPHGQSATLSPALTYNAPPSVVTDLPSSVLVGESVHFTVTVTDPEGDQVNLNLLNPPPGCVFTPVIGGSSPAAAKASWMVVFGGTSELIFEASDTVFPGQKTRLTVPMKVMDTYYRTRLMVADVTGDGVPDTVAGAAGADVGGVTDTGAIYVWEGTESMASSPTATLIVPGAAANDNLGDSGSGRGILCADVTGDGVPDIVAGAYVANAGGVTDAGAVYVWAGGSGLTGRPAPTATLTITGAKKYDNLGSISHGQGLHCVDVTDDGVLDIVAGAYRADVGGVTNTGAIYVWAGGSGLAGTPAPTTTLTITGAAANDMLGFIPGGQGLLCADVTGDGVPDIVAGAFSADVGGTSDTGAVYVWAGGSGLAGTPAPTATLTVTGAVTGDELGNTETQGLLCRDVTGDSVLDIVAGACKADVAGQTDTGAIYVWAGGSGLAGTPAPTAT